MNWLMLSQQFVWFVSVYDGCFIKDSFCDNLFVSLCSLFRKTLAEVGDLVDNCMIMWPLVSDVLQVSAVNKVIGPELLQPKWVSTNLYWTPLSGCHMLLLLNTNNLAQLSLARVYQGHSKTLSLALSHTPRRTTTHIFTVLLPAPPYILSSFLDGERGD